MMDNKEFELTSAVMLYAIRCLADGDQAALRSMNFGPREVEALREMNLADLCRIETLRAHCLEISLNRDVYWPMVAHLRHLRENDELQKALMAADAPHELMQTFFGMSGREYSRLRRMLVANMVCGRPPEATEEEIQRLWDAWQQRAELEEDGLLPPQEYLSLLEETDIPLRVIWHQTRRWVDYGPLPHPAARPSASPARRDGTA
ncbi:MAG: DUF2857 domain-containing protein [Woeseia sp.]